MRLKKRTRSSRWRGSLTHGRGFKKKARGSGHQGGKGMAGTGKRGDQKKTLILNLYGNDYFGKDKALRRGNLPPKVKSVNLFAIEQNLDSYVANNQAKLSKNVYEINLSDHKILGEGAVARKMKITAHSASASAIDKVKKAGGEIIVKFSKDKKEK